MCTKDSYRIPLRDIRPSELYLSSERLKGMDESSYGPLPVRKIAGELFFTDGHHRAYTMWKNGEEEVEVYHDHDDLNWFHYLICVDWCREEGINHIGDLGERIVSEEDFKTLWVGRCRKMHEDDEGKYLCVKEEEDPDSKSRICETILRSLPQWFGIEKAIVDYVKGVREMPFIVAYVGSIPVGFVTLKEHHEYTSELYVMGLVKELHGRGIGKLMMNSVHEKLVKEGKKYLTVKTLSDSDPDENYGRTRAFYRSMGFYPLEEFPTLWDEYNPCLLMIKVLG